MLKPQIVSELGEQALLLPELVNRGLLANDRVKYLFSLLQTAWQQARDPQTAYPDLQTERLASGLDDATLDAVVAGSRTEGATDIVMPNAAAIFDHVAV
ncbi:MAG: hypothetical protein KJO38_08605, partial [Gammaproteobacteria bacterium]|nr:hypothetical protein [Gammaproteobacteria bacterium]